MLRIIGSLGDRMLQLVVPKTVASAASTAADCGWSVICKPCNSTNCSSTQYRWQCCEATGCKCLFYKRCGCFIGCPC